MSPTGSNGNDGAFDRVEFGWYVVDCAEVDADKMDGVVAEFEECVKVLVKRMGAKTMDQLRFGESKTLSGSLATTNVKLSGEEDEGFLAKAGNFFEKVTGVDLDGDGDVGMAGSDNAPRKMANLYEVLVAASQQERRKFFNAGRRLIELEEMVENSWWLSPGMLKMKVDQRDGPTSASAKLAAFLQGRW